MKKCLTCGVEKPETDFAYTYHKAQPIGTRKGVCRACTYRRNRRRRLEQRNLHIINELLARGCHTCGIQHQALYIYTSGYPEGRGISREELAGKQTPWLRKLLAGGVIVACRACVLTARKNGDEELSRPTPHEQGWGVSPTKWQKASELADRAASYQGHVTARDLEVLGLDCKTARKYLRMFVESGEWQWTREIVRSGRGRPPLAITRVGQ